MYTAEEIQRIVTPIADRYNLDRIYLFGSYARGDSTPNSDIDLRVDRGGARGMQMAFLLTDLEDALQKHVDLLSTTVLDSEFLNSIREEEKLIYERT